jgi:hypothetical protein
MVDIRKDVEKEKMKSLKGFQKIWEKFSDISDIIESLPGKVV